jgi:hypothetical protein
MPQTSSTKDCDWKPVTSSSVNGSVYTKDVSYRGQNRLKVKKLQQQQSQYAVDLIEQDAWVMNVLAVCDKIDKTHFLGNEPHEVIYRNELKKEIKTHNGISQCFEPARANAPTQGTVAPILTFYGVDNASTLTKMLNQAYTVDRALVENNLIAASTAPSASSAKTATQIVIQGLNQLLYQCFLLGCYIGFSHGDMHTGNILCDKDKFVLIDYGRAFVNMHDVQINLEIDDKKKSALMGQLNEIISSVNIPPGLTQEYKTLNGTTFLSYFTKNSMYLPMKMQVEHFNQRSHMIMMDIAGLCFFIYANFQKSIRLIPKYNTLCNNCRVLYTGASPSHIYCNPENMEWLKAPIDDDDLFVSGVRFFYVFIYSLSTQYMTGIPVDGPPRKTIQAYNLQHIITNNIVYKSFIINPEAASKAYTKWYPEEPRGGKSRQSGQSRQSRQSLKQTMKQKGGHQVSPKPSIVTEDPPEPSISDIDVFEAALEVPRTAYKPKQSDIVFEENANVQLKPFTKGIDELQASAAKLNQENTETVKNIFTLLKDLSDKQRNTSISNSDSHKESAKNTTHVNTETVQGELSSEKLIELFSGKQGGKPRIKPTPQAQQQYIQLKSRNKPSRVYTDDDKKKYIRLNNERVYLSAIKGKYRYKCT